MKAEVISGDVYGRGDHNSSHEYLLPGTLRQLSNIQRTTKSEMRLLEVG